MFFKKICMLGGEKEMWRVGREIVMKLLAFTCNQTQYTFDYFNFYLS
jgi:hypothetical protein